MFYFKSYTIKIGKVSAQFFHANQYLPCAYLFVCLDAKPDLIAIQSKIK